MTLTIDNIEAARRRLQGILKPTPLLRSATLDRMLAAQGAAESATRGQGRDDESASRDES